METTGVVPLIFTSTLKIEAVCSSETLVIHLQVHRTTTQKTNLDIFTVVRTSVLDV
jgi:hypothetical protein